MATITGPKKLNGWVLGAQFTDGVAVSDAPPVLALFHKLPGYKVDKSAPVSLAKPHEEVGEDGDGA